MRLVKHFKAQPSEPLQVHQFYTLITIYRWLALLPPALILVISGEFSFNINLAFLLLAVVNAVLQTVFYFKRRVILRKDFIYESSSNAKNRKVRLLGLVGIELLVCVLLNTPQNSPYYLYALTPIFYCAFFLGLSGALFGAAILSLSLIAASVTLLFINNRTTNWITLNTELVCFWLVAALAGYLFQISEHLRQYALIIKRYQGSLERQNSSLQRANRQLEYLSDFSGAIREGNTPEQVEELALQYLTRLAAQRSPTRSQTNHAPAPAQILSCEILENWLGDHHSSQNCAAPASTASLNVIRLNNRGLYYWVAPLIYKGEQFGALALQDAFQQMEDETDLETVEENLLLTLLADQLARVLGSLKQSQALAVEAERARLAMDMHDVVAQALFGIAYNLDACIKLSNTNPQLAQQKLTDLRTLAFDTLSSVRAIIYDLWNEENSDTDFGSLLQAYLKKAGPLYPFQIRLEVKAFSKDTGKDIAKRTGFRLDRETQKGLYRMVQEALANASKHSGASQVLIELSQNGQELKLVVSDNGRGFEANQVQRREVNSTPSGGMGLGAMRERIEQLGGKLSVESRPGGGTSLIAKLPLPI